MLRLCIMALQDVYRAFFLLPVRVMDVIYWGTIVWLLAYIFVYSRNTYQSIEGVVNVAALASLALPGYLLATILLGVIYGTKSFADTLVRRWPRSVAARRTWGVTHVIITWPHRKVVMDLVWCLMLMFTIIGDRMSGYTRDHHRNPTLDHVRLLAFLYGGSVAYRTADVLFA